MTGTYCLWGSLWKCRRRLFSFRLCAKKHLVKCLLLDEFLIFHLTPQRFIRKCIDHLIAKMPLPYFLVGSAGCRVKKTSSSVCVSTSVNELGKLRPDSFFSLSRALLIYGLEHAVKTERGPKRALATAAQRDGGERNVNDWMLHIFIEHICCKRIALIVSLYCIFVGKERKHTAAHTHSHSHTRCSLLPSLCFDILMKPNTTE